MEELFLLDDELPDEYDLELPDLETEVLVPLEEVVAGLRLLLTLLVFFVLLPVVALYVLTGVLFSEVVLLILGFDEPLLL